MGDATPRHGTGHQMPFGELAAVLRRAVHFALTHSGTWHSDCGTRRRFSHPAAQCSMFPSIEMIKDAMSAAACLVGQCPDNDVSRSNSAETSHVPFSNELQHILAFHASPTELFPSDRNNSLSFPVCFEESASSSQPVMSLTSISTFVGSLRPLRPDSDLQYTQSLS